MNNIDIVTAQAAATQIRHHFSLDVFPETGIVLGSGLGGFTQIVKTIASIAYSEIINFPHSTVDGHKGQFSIVELDNGKRAIVMEGRFHLYEGIPPNEVTLPIVVMHLLGVKNLILSNAAGGINAAFQAGGLMIINDHINFTGNHPLIGKNDTKYGPRFLDQTEPYNQELIKLAKKLAPECDIDAHEGVYLAVTGPTYETRAEIRAFHAMGADAVGMSTVYEAIVANYLGMKVLGISSITNMATGIAQSKHEHSNVVYVANQITSKFSNWVKHIVAHI